MMKRLFALLLAAFLTLSSSPAVSASEAWAPQIDHSSPNFEYPEDNRLFIRESNSANNHTFMRFRSGDWSTVCEDVGANWDCGSGKKGDFYGYVVLPVCGAIVENCIDKVSIYTEGSAPATATLVRTVEGAKFKGFPNRGIPSGGGVSIFSSDVEHSPGQNLYAVQAQIQITFGKTKTQIERMELSVVPIVAKTELRAKSPRFTKDGCDNWPDGAACLEFGEFADNHLCVFQEDGVCAIAQDFAPETRAGVQLKLSNQISGWFKGRIQDPQLAVSKIDDRYSLVNIDASPVEVPRFYYESRPKLTGGPSITEVLGYAPGQGAGLTLVDAFRPDAFKVVRAYRNATKDTAAGVSNLWSVGTINKFEISKTGDPKGCLQDQSRLVGLVTTNAMVYENGAPSYRSGFLNYKVAGLHYLPDGTEALGSYDLIIRSDVARCLYGFSNAPLSASITVSGDGDKNIATTTVREKGGWLKLAAYGFTFSEKTIKVKLTQKKQTTITCVAPGKKSQKVTAAKPKCPKGFKKR